ncbi:hypothetical protein [Dialister succinatiphilus]|jgi:drug/metabolite transporter (DMT)-like permease|uniref:hypothetical protein n=1 Tax=Dialister succinatiphilus TaxID=487173 RepID=UPI00235202BB|nr:hypothetical protein [Dialister succinatiphilus]
MELWNLWWPVGLVVLADVFYQVCARRLSTLQSPLAALGMTYLVSACLCALLFEILIPGGHIFHEIWPPHPEALLVGLAITGLEVGSIFMYRAGWPMNIGFLVYTALAIVVLLMVGHFMYGESLRPLQQAGIGLAAAGMFLIVR